MTERVKEQDRMGGWRGGEGSKENSEKQSSQGQRK